MCLKIRVISHVTHKKGKEVEEQFELPELQEPLQPRDWSELDQSIQVLGEAIESVAKALAESIKLIADAIMQAVAQTFDAVVKVLDVCVNADVPPRWIYMSKYARKYRTRKKYANMIERALIKAIKFKHKQKCDRHKLYGTEIEHIYVDEFVTEEEAAR